MREAAAPWSRSTFIICGEVQGLSGPVVFIIIIFRFLSMFPDGAVGVHERVCAHVCVRACVCVLVPVLISSRSEHHRVQREQAVKKSQGPHGIKVPFEANINRTAGSDAAACRQLPKRRNSESTTNLHSITKHWLT